MKLLVGVVPDIRFLDGIVGYIYEKFEIEGTCIINGDSLLDLKYVNPTGEFRIPRWKHYIENFNYRRAEDMTELIQEKNPKVVVARIHEANYIKIIFPDVEYTAHYVEDLRPILDYYTFSLKSYNAKTIIPIRLNQ